LVFAGVALMVGFFLPWIDLGGFVRVSGFDAVWHGGAAWYTRGLLALLPFAGAALALAGLTGSRSAPLLGLGVGGGVLGYVLVKTVWSFVETTGWGMWLVLGGATVALVAGTLRARPTGR
jgi:hypothetical protein